MPFDFVLAFFKDSALLLKMVGLAFPNSAVAGSLAVQWITSKWSITIIMIQITVIN